MNSVIWPMNPSSGMGKLFMCFSRLISLDKALTNVFADDCSTYFCLFVMDKCECILAVSRL